MSSHKSLLQGLDMIQKFLLKSFAFVFCFFLLFTSTSQASIAPNKGGKLFAKDAFPFNVFRLHKNGQNLLIVEKATHRVHLFSSDSEGKPKYVKSYRAATGKVKGNKSIQNDLKTPEGVYFLTSFISSQELLDRYGELGKQYGIGAFVLNYPNLIDKRNRKSGGGIWIHSTDDNERISKGLDSRGCTVLTDEDFVDLAKYVTLGETMAVIVQEMHLMSDKTWSLNRKEIEKTFNNWLTAWQNKDIKNYLENYHKAEFKDHYRGKFNQFAQYKQNLFKRPGVIKVEASNISIVNDQDYAVIQFDQKYVSDLIDDIGQKTLFLRRDKEYNWRIVAETWHKKKPFIKEDNEFVLVPSYKTYGRNKDTAKLQESNKEQQSENI